jgi:transposase
MLYVGVDIHKKNLQVCVLGEDGKQLGNCKVANERESVVGYFCNLARPAAVAMEPTHNWGGLYDLLETMGLEVHVAHPRDVELIGKCKVSTDKTSAYKLAALLRAGFLPEAYVSDPEGRELRRLARARASLTRQSTQIKNQIHALLRENWIKVPFSDAFGVGGMQFLRDLKLPRTSKLLLDLRLERLVDIHKGIASLDEEISRRAFGDRRAVLLMTIKGIAEYSAILILAEIGRIERFGRAESLVRYAGLNPTEHSSGERTRRGSLEKAGSRWLRWILVEAVEHTIREEGKIRDLYLRVLEKKGHNWAIVAAARELLVSIFWMLTRMEPYRPSGKRQLLSQAGEAR